ncbi:MAG TPA: hydrogenase maturation nickel metallochaperone HypA [Thermodesulfovibrionia bacterium]|nr:hydrogenase maturation nickel metallochaperone HypA [Thermodesulfovibrionia bacterium]
MHELGLMQNIVETVEDYSRKNNAKKVLTVILEIGKLSGVVPTALEFCFDVCIKGTLLQGAKLEIQQINSLGLCKICRKEFDLLENKFSCPICKKEDWEIISGKEIIIKGLEVI